ncbi:MAG: NADH-quinone oxidoreductase subunit M, partial [Rhodospirillaceae bacterium]
MLGFPILSVTTFLPMVGVVFLLLLPGDNEAVKQKARYIALWTSLITFVSSLVMLASFDSSSASFQFVELVPWIPTLGLSYHMGVDGISILFILLSTFLTPLCVIASWTSVQKQV